MTRSKISYLDETISSVIGKNKQKGTLGKLIDFYLELAEKDHSIKSIDETE